MRIADSWKDFEIVATGGGEKLERWGEYFLIRPDPLIIWDAKEQLRKLENVHAIFEQTERKSGWNYLREMPKEFVIGWQNLRFKLKLERFKHTGLFPEQAVNWQLMAELIKNTNRKIDTLNLFAYTGGATLACAEAGSSVCHVDSSKTMVDRAAQNAVLSNQAKKPIRYIVDDCMKFCQRELRRENRYDAIVLDPPSFGRGASGEIWKMEDNIFALCKLLAKLLSDKPLFVCLNSYTTGLQSGVLKNILELTLPSKPRIIADEIGILGLDNIVLPQGCTAFAEYS